MSSGHLDGENSQESLIEQRGATVNRRNFIQRISVAVAALGLPGFKKSSIDGIPYEFMANITKIVGSERVWIDWSQTSPFPSDETIVRLLGSTKEVEQWTVTYTDPCTNMLVVRKGEYVGSPPV
jgi:hypothetical protein